MYYRESFEYSPIKMFFNSNSADTIVSRGNVTFNLNNNINLPNHVIGYVSLNELTIPNTNYNINSSNNKLVLLDSSGTTAIFTVPVGNYTISQFIVSLNVQFQTCATASYRNITATCPDLTNMCTLTHSTSYFLNILPTTTMSKVLGFETGTISSSPIYGCSITSGAMVGSIFIIAGTNDNFIYQYADNTPITLTLPAGGLYTGTQCLIFLNTSFQANNVPILASFNATTRLFTFTNSTTNIPFKLLGTSTVLTGFGFANANTTYSSTSLGAVANSSLTSSRIVDLSGNNSFFVATNLGLANYSFLNPNNKGGANVLGKVQLTSSQMGIEFYNNLTAFKTRFYDTNITKIHITLYDENFNPWVPLSDWGCVLEMTFYEKYDLTTKLKTNNLLFSS